MGLFSKSKDHSENKDASEIKQATISDSQKKSIDSVPTPNTQNQTVSNNGASQSENPNFVNPFAGQGSSQNNSSNSNNSFNTQSLGNEQTQGQNTNMNSMMQNTNPTGSMGMGQQTPNNPMPDLGSMQTQSENNSVDFDKIQEMIDETVEKIIEEKWNSLEDKVNKVLRWKETKDSEINMLKEDLVAVADGFNKLEMKLINKISNYDKNIMDVNSEIKALEKVFQKVTPTLINNVNELSKIADEFRGVEPKKRKVMSEDDFKVDTENENNNSKSGK